MTLEIKIKNKEKVREFLNDLAHRFGDLSRPFTDFGEYKLRALRQQWNREENPYGEKWAPLDPAYVEEKRRLNKMPGILVRDNVLRDSFSYSAGPDTLRIGTNINYAPKHQLGIGVKKREFLGVNDEDLQELIDTFVSYLPIK